MAVEERRNHTASAISYKEDLILEPDLGANTVSLQLHFESSDISIHAHNTKNHNPLTHQLKTLPQNLPTRPSKSTKCALPTARCPSLGYTAI
jgi:hypothetical protein